MRKEFTLTREKYRPIYWFLLFTRHWRNPETWPTQRV